MLDHAGQWDVLDHSGQWDMLDHAGWPVGQALSDSFEFICAI